MPPCQATHKRIFHNAGQCGVSHYEPALSPTVEPVCQQTKRVGISLKMRDVRPKIGTQFVFEILPVALCKERLYSLFAAVSERRIAHIVS